MQLTGKRFAPVCGRQRLMAAKAAPEDRLCLQDFFKLHSGQRSSGIDNHRLAMLMAPYLTNVKEAPVQHAYHSSRRPVRPSFN
ncbi:hypothetical protein [Rhizobium mongolense]|uniref:Uncharacterized protein n=1 Tax=Rhizobium mongolense TaxID=57676 RepID=A0A7W6RV84_9HYPH|nr:hypothetical protein [Rhizobium mongolense]MBB4279267.1 hypothetical protein [Rhizobium mongolense]